MAEPDFVDLTKREYRLSPEDIEIVENNPRGLTKEGVMVKVWLWFQANNVPCQMRFLAMYQHCKKLAKSGTLDDGSVILSRRTHTDSRGITKSFITKEKIGQTDELGNLIIAESVEKLEEFVKSKTKNLSFITKRGL